MERVKSAYGILRSNAPPTVTVWIHCRTPFSTSYQNRFAISPAQETSAFTESTAGKSKAPLLPRWKPKSFWFVEIRLYNAAGICSAVFVTERSISAGVSAVMEVPLIFQMKPFSISRFREISFPFIPDKTEAGSVLAPFMIMEMVSFSLDVLIRSLTVSQLFFWKLPSM